MTDRRETVGTSRAHAAADTFDYVVVGGGTAGCVVASRLSEDPQATVLLLEAGGDERRHDVETPELWASLLGTDADWAYETPCQPQTGHVHAAPRGRVLGGSGSINCMTHLRGHRTDYEAWAAAGAEGWSYADVLPLFKRMEDVPDGDPAYRGTGGPLHPKADPTHAFARAWIEGARLRGYPVADDFNAAEMLGAGASESLIHEGKRESTATAYLRPAMDRPNLTVRTDAEVHRLLLTGERCDGVTYVAAGRLREARAGVETILCAGAVNSPALLLRSGLGPADELRGLGIDPVLDLPGVGRNLQDHILLAGVRYLADTATPPFTGAGGGSTLLTTLDGGAHGPDLHVAVMDGDYCMPWQQSRQNCFTITIGQMRPYSRGRVRLAAADPAVNPIVDPCYLDDPRDVETLVRGIEIADEIVQTGVFAEWGGRSETTDLLGLGHADLRRAINDGVSSYFHLSGTCRMGADADAVLDRQLRVNGISGLRVADASVMPTVVSCNTNAACVMIGEKLADLVRGLSPVPAGVRAEVGG